MEAVVSKPHHACPDLRWIDNKIRRLRGELNRGYEHAAGAGYSMIEIEDLIEDHRERYMRHMRENPEELSQYLVERDEVIEE